MKLEKIYPDKNYVEQYAKFQKKKIKNKNMQSY